MDNTELPHGWDIRAILEQALEQAALEQEQRTSTSGFEAGRPPQPEYYWSMGVEAGWPPQPEYYWSMGVEAGWPPQPDFLTGTSGVEAGWPPQPDVLTATGVEAGRSKARRSKARKDWSCARKQYRSMYIPVDNPNDAPEGDRVSDTFKRSNFDYMIVTNSHGGLTDTGMNDLVRRPLFETQHNVIFPVRCGVLLEIQRLPEPLDELAEKLPMTPSEFTGQSLVDALHDCEFTRGISQYDIGASVPNLEIFTGGTYRGYKDDDNECDAIDDDVLLYDAAKHTFMSLKVHMEKLVDKVKPIVDITHVKPLRTRRSKKNTKKNDKVKPTITKLVDNKVPFYSLSKTHKLSHNHPDDTPLTLADLCENNGLIEKLVTMLKEDGNIDANAEASNIPVLVLACRCIPGNANWSFPLGSPTSSNYFTDVGSQNSKSSMLCHLDDGVTGHARCGSVGARSVSGSVGARSVSGSVGARSVSVPDDELDVLSIDEDIFDQGQGGFWQDQGVFWRDQEGDQEGGRNATKKRRKRRNATKKRRKRRNATKKRRKRRS